MSARRAIWEVARREIVERSRSRVMRITIVVLLLVSIGGSIAAARLSGQTPTDEIGLVGAQSVALQTTISAHERAAGRRAHVHVLASRGAAARAVRGGTLAVAVIDGARLLVKSSRSQTAVRVVQGAVAAARSIDRLRSLGLTDSQVLSAVTPAPLPVDVLDPRGRDLERNRGLIAIGLGALLMALLGFGQAVAQGVTEEKSSRVVELLLTTVSPRRLLAGKVLGIGSLGLAQLVLLGGSGLIAGALAGGVGRPAAAPKAVALVVLWFVLGYAFYSVAFAAAGALVSRQEDLTTAVMPITFTLLGAFYLSLIATGDDANGTVARIAAFIPPLAPMVVPARMVLGDMSVLGMVIAVAIDLAATAGLIVLAARIYERAILRIGAPLRLHRLLVAGGVRTAPVEPDVAAARIERIADGAGRAVAVVSLLASVAIGLEHAAAIVLLAFGLLILVVLETRKHGWGRRAH